MKKRFLILAITIVGLYSCEKSENVTTNGETTTVKFAPAIEAPDSKDVGRSNGMISGSQIGAEGNVLAAIDKFFIEANAMGEVFKSEFYVRGEAYDSNTHTDVSIKTLVGPNTFRLYTTSKMETAENDPRGTERDGFSAWNRFDYSKPVFNSYKSKYGLIETTEQAAKALRMLPPYAEFEGTAERVVKATDTKPVDVLMKAKHGRFIATIEFEENSDLLMKYSAKCKMTIKNANENAGIAPAVVSDVLLGYDNNVSTVPFTWFYATNSKINEDAAIELKIDIYKGGQPGQTSGEILKSYTIANQTAVNILGSGKYNPKVSSLFKVDNGVDKWIRIIIRESAVSVETGNLFDITWDWDEADGTLDLE